MSEVKRDCDHGRQIGKCVDCDYAALESDYATLQAECERFERELSSLGESLIESMRENAKLRVECERLRAEVKTVNGHADKWNKIATDLGRELELLSDELAAIKAQEPVGYFVHNGQCWGEVNPQFQDDADVHALYELPSITKIHTKTGTHQND